MAYLQCPECRLTVAASAYYLRGDQCPRCLTSMEPKAAIGRRAAPTAAPRAVHAGVAAPKSPDRRLGA
jgi:hypothetical protein